MFFRKTSSTVLDERVVTFYGKRKRIVGIDGGGGVR
jgi:hypothetical protein